MPVKKFLKAAKEIESHKARKVEEAKHAAHGDEEGWLVSYADMMTLLCGFFIMLFSMATLDEPKYDGFKQAVASTFGGNYQNPTKEMANFVSQILQENGVEKDTVVQSDPSGVTVVFESTVFFGTLVADISPEGQNVLNKLIDGIRVRETEEKKSFKIVVEGHTDSRPVLSGPFPTNWELSAARASRVVRMFLERGFESERMTAIGYADTRPFAKSRSLAGIQDPKLLAKNRRVVLRILRPNASSIPFPGSVEVYGPEPAATAH